MFNFSNHSADAKYYDDSIKLVAVKMKDILGGVAVEEFDGLKPKMNSFLVDNNRKQQKAKDLNENVVARIIQGKYKDLLLNYKFLKHSMNKIQSKDHRIETYKRCLSCFDDKIHTQDNEYNELALGCKS